MRKFHIELSRGTRELAAGVREITTERPALFAKSGLVVRFEKTSSADPGYSVTRDGERLTVRYSTKNAAFRALGRILGADPADLAGGFEETPRFDTIGFMLDVSRNGVPTIQTMKSLLRRAALMGINVCTLYTEDVYEVPGEPFFGYLRGRYSQAELRAFDRYAATLGIEMFASMQALAHLEQILQWPAYKDYRDTGSVLLAEHDATYALLEKMIRAAAAPYKSKRIGLGMDEAVGIGTGRYRQLFGHADPFVILNRHLARVNDICRRLGLRPIISSDMYFRLGSKTHMYYDRTSVIPPEVYRNIPPDVQLLYWDYYHKDVEFYEEWIDRHRAMGCEPVVLGGVWTWSRLWCDLEFTFRVTDPCMRACKTRQVREVMVSLWGDDGNEYDLYSSLPGLQFFAEHAWSDGTDMSVLPSRLMGSSEADFNAYVRASALDNFPQRQRHPEDSDASNVSKWLVFQDPLLSFLDHVVEGLSVKEHYSAIAKDLRAATGGPGCRRLAFPAQVAKTIVIKCDLRKRLAAAQAKGDRKAVKRLVAGDLARLRREVVKLWKLHRDVWFSEYKPFGWEVIEHRYGGLIARIDTAASRLSAYASGKAEPLPELAVKFEKPFPAKNVLPTFLYSRIKTPSCIK